MWVSDWFRVSAGEFARASGLAMWRASREVIQMLLPAGGERAKDSIGSTVPALYTNRGPTQDRLTFYLRRLAAPEAQTRAYPFRFLPSFASDLRASNGSRCVEPSDHSIEKGNGSQIHRGSGQSTSLMPLLASELLRHSSARNGDVLRAVSGCCVETGRIVGASTVCASLFLPGPSDRAGFLDRVDARGAAFFVPAFRGTRAAPGAAAATRVRGPLGSAATGELGRRVGRHRLDIEPILLDLLFQVDSVHGLDGLRIRKLGFHHFLGRGDRVFRRGDRGRRDGLLRTRAP